MIKALTRTLPSALKYSPVWLVLLTLYLLLYFYANEVFLPTLQFALSALVRTSPFILFAVTMVALLKATGAESILADAFQGHGYRMIFVAALIGGLAPFCSCEVIPFVAALLGAGVPISAVMAFWLSSPLMDPAALTITAAALGWKFAIGKAVAAVAVGLFGGVVLKLIADTAPGFLHAPLKQGQFNRCGCGTSATTGRPVWAFWRESRRRTAFVEEMRGNGLFLLKWLAFAYTIEALMVRYVPAELIGSLVGGDGVWPIMTASLLGAPAYLNGFAAPAIVNGFMQQGMSTGAAMSFLIAGGVTSIPAMTAVFALVKVRLFSLYILLGFVGAILSGLIFSTV